jgi:signal transduction histidine kinase
MATTEPLRPALDSSFTGLVEMAAGLLMTWFVVAASTAVLWPPERQFDVGREEALVCGVGAVAVILSRRLGRQRSIALVAIPLVVLAAQTLVKVAHGLHGSWLLVTVTATVATVVAALLTRPLVVVATGAVAVALLPLAAAGNPPGALDRPWLMVVTQVATVVVYAAIAAYAAALLRRSARQTDVTLVRADQVVAANRHARDVAAAAERARRSIHDTALNTLEAVARSGTDIPVDRLRHRCAQDAEALRPLAFPVGQGAPADLRGLVNRATARAQSVGLSCTSATTVEGTPPATVLAAAMDAVGEAIVNAGKHSGATTVHLEVVAAADALQVDVIDEGVGFDPSRSGTEGFGVRDSLQARMTDVGGAAWVTTRPGSGTRVALRWPAADPVAAEPGLAPVDLNDAVRAMTAALIVLSVGLGLVALLMSWWSLGRPWIALVVSGSLAAWSAYLLLRIRRQGGLRGSDVLLTLSAIAWATVLTPVADPFCTVAAGPLVPLDARLALAVTLVVLAPALWVVLATALVLVGSGVAAVVLSQALWPGCGSDTLIQLAVAVGAVGVAALFGRTLRRQVVAAAAARQAAFEAAARVRAEVSIEQDRRRWIRPAVLPALQLLEGLADGRLSAAATSVRDRCARSATLLRSVLSVTAAPPMREVHAQLCDAVLAAYRGGVAVEVRGEIAALRPPEQARRALLEVLHALPDLCPFDDPVVCFGYADHERQGMSVVGSSAGPAPRSWPRPGPGDGWSLDDDSDASGLAVAVEWPTRLSTQVSPEPPDGGSSGERC